MFARNLRLYTETAKVLHLHQIYEKAAALFKKGGGFSTNKDVVITLLDNYADLPRIAVDAEAQDVYARG